MTVSDLDTTMTERQDALRPRSKSPIVPMSTTSPRPLGTFNRKSPLAIGRICRGAAMAMSGIETWASRHAALAVGLRVGNDHSTVKRAKLAVLLMSRMPSIIAAFGSRRSEVPICCNAYF